MAEQISTPNNEESSQRDEHLISEAEIDEFQTYWNSLNLAEKKDFFKVSYSDLLVFSKKFSKAEELLEEALRVAEYEKEWNVWKCCSCNMKHTDSKSHFQHVLMAYDHLNSYYSPIPGTMTMSERSKLVLPFEIDEKWISTINNENWEPADISVLYTIREKKLALLSSEIRKQVPSFELLEYDPKLWSTCYFSDQSWPSCNDSTRKARLKSIQLSLQNLLKDDLLLRIHLDHVIDYAMVKLQERVLRPRLLQELGLHESHLCICLLGASELQGILSFLQVLEERGVAYERLKRSAPCFESEVKMKDKSFYLLVDEHSYCDDSTKPALEPHKSDTLLSWIFSKQENLQQPESWANSRQERINSGRKELYHFRQILDERKEEVSAFKWGITELAALTTDSYANDIQLIGRGNWTVKLTDDILRFETGINANADAAADYKSFLLFLLKAFLQDKLKKVINSGTRYVSQDVGTVVLEMHGENTR